MTNVIIIYHQQAIVFGNGLRKVEDKACVDLNETIYASLKKCFRDLQNKNPKDHLKMFKVFYLL